MVANGQTASFAESSANQTDETKSVSPPATPVSEQTNVAERELASDDTPSLQIDVVRIGPEGSAVFAGKGSPDADVVIFEKDRVLAQTSVSADGEWVAVADQPLSPGGHLIIAEMTTVEGEVSRANQAVIVELASSGQDTPLVALVPMNEQAEVELIQTPDPLLPHQRKCKRQRRRRLKPRAEVVLVDSRPFRADFELGWPDNLFIKGSSLGGGCAWKAE